MTDTKTIEIPVRLLFKVPADFNEAQAIELAVTVENSFEHGGVREALAGGMDQLNERLGLWDQFTEADDDDETVLAKYDGYAFRPPGDRVVHLLDNDGVESNVLLSSLTPGVYVCSPPDEAPQFVSGPFVWGTDAFVVDIQTALEGTDENPAISLLVVDDNGWVEVPRTWFEIPDPGPSFGDVLVVEEKQKRIGTLLRAAADEHDLIALNYLTDAIDLALNLLHVRWDREANEIIPTPGSKYQPLED